MRKLEADVKANYLNWLFIEYYDSILTIQKQKAHI